MRAGRQPAVVRSHFAELPGKESVFGGVCLEGVHPNVNETLAKDLQSSNPSLEVLQTSVKPLKLVKPEYEPGAKSFQEVTPQFDLYLNLSRSRRGL